jgi:hypothetical protein
MAASWDWNGSPADMLSTAYISGTDVGRTDVDSRKFILQNSEALARKSDGLLL